MSKDKELLQEAVNIFLDLKRCCDFYGSAIEVDCHVDNSIAGYEFEAKIDLFLRKFYHKDIEWVYIYPTGTIIKNTEDEDNK